MSASTPITERRYVVPLVLVTSLFFLWAIGVNLNDILIQHFKKASGLTDTQSSLIQFAFFGGYFLAALPAGWLMRDALATYSDQAQRLSNVLPGRSSPLHGPVSSPEGAFS